MAAILYRHGLAVVKAGGLAEINLLAVAGERLVGAVEVKRRYHEAARYPTLYINLRKVAAMATWSVALGVPAWFVVVYDDQVQAISLADLPGAVGGCRVDGYRVRHGATALEPVLEVRVNAMRLIGRTEETAEVEIGGPASIPDQSRMVDLDGQPLLRDQATLDQAVAIAGRLAPLLGGDRVGHFGPISPLDQPPGLLGGPWRPSPGPGPDHLPAAPAGVAPGGHPPPPASPGPPGHSPAGRAPRRGGRPGRHRPLLARTDQPLTPDWITGTVALPLAAFRMAPQAA